LIRVSIALLAATLAVLTLARCAREDDGWVVVSGKHDGKPLIVRFRATMPRQLTPGRYPTLTTIVWRYEGAASGLPPDDVSTRMDRLEDLLAQRVEAQGVAFHTATVTGDGTREWQVYAQSEDAMTRALNDALRGDPVYPIEIHFAPDPEWLQYHGLARLRE
jgi:hypothetical protein